MLSLHRMRNARKNKVSNARDVYPLFDFKAPSGFRRVPLYASDFLIGTKQPDDRITDFRMQTCSLDVASWRLRMDSVLGCIGLPTLPTCLDRCSLRHWPVLPLINSPVMRRVTKDGSITRLCCYNAAHVYRVDFQLLLRPNAYKLLMCYLFDR